MIAVIGIPRLRGSAQDADVAGLAASIAVGAAAAGSRVELVGKIGDDPAGDAVLLALSRRGVGHVATLRDPAHATPLAADAGDDPDAEATPESGGATGAAQPPELDPADVGLALRYLPELAVLVAVHVRADVIAEIASAAGWANTTLIVVLPTGEPAPDDLPSGALALAVDESDELGGVGGSIGRYAAAVDQGGSPEAAYRELVAVAEAPA